MTEKDRQKIRGNSCRLEGGGSFRLAPALIVTSVLWILYCQMFTFMDMIENVSYCFDYSLVCFVAVWSQCKCTNVWQWLPAVEDVDALTLYIAVAGMPPITAAVPSTSVMDFLPSTSAQTQLWIRYAIRQKWPPHFRNWRKSEVLGTS